MKTNLTISSYSIWQILYLDSLDHDEPVPSEEECPIRAAAWDDKLIQAVMRKDAKGNGVFGKLKVSSCLFCLHGIPCI
jgi:hypothetical protein